MKISFTTRQSETLPLSLSFIPVFSSFVVVVCAQGERATGFGVALLMALFGQASDDSLLNKVSPLGNASAKSRDQPDQVDQRDCKRRRLV